MILVDSSVWIDYFNGRLTWQTDVLDAYLGKTLIFTGDLILTELLQGFRSSKDFEQAKTFLDLLPFRHLGGHEIAVQSAKNYRFLRRSGLTVRKTIDVVIGTFCIVEGLTLLHDDRDFDPLSAHLGLKTLDPDRSRP